MKYKYEPKDITLEEYAVLCIKKGGQKISSKGSGRYGYRGRAYEILCQFEESDADVVEIESNAPVETTRNNFRQQIRRCEGMFDDVVTSVVGGRVFLLKDRVFED